VFIRTSYKTPKGKRVRFSFWLERRGDVVCLVESSGGVRPANMHEVAMWKMLSRYDEPLAPYFPKNSDWVKMAKTELQRLNRRNW